VKPCSWCDGRFSPNVSYQIYCSAVCRESATKEKILTRYSMSKRQKRKSKNRKCINCKSSLSIYNDNQICHECSINPKSVTKALKKIKGMSK
jgi:hypothetical protein